MEGPIVFGVNLDTYSVEFFDDVTYCEGREIFQEDVPSLDMDFCI